MPERPSIIIRDSYLLVFRLGGSGCEHYTQEDRFERSQDDRLTAHWVTTKVVDSISEMKALTKWLDQARYRIFKLAPRTIIGLVVPAGEEAKVVEELNKITMEVSEYNSRHSLTRASFFYTLIKLESSNTELGRILREDIAELLTQIQVALSKVDLKALKAVLVKAKGIDRLLVSQQGKKVRQALAQVEKQAKRVARVAKETECDVEEMKKVVDLAPIELARFAILEEGETPSSPLASIGPRPVEI